MIPFIFGHFVSHLSLFHGVRIILFSGAISELNLKDDKGAAYVIIVDLC